MAITQQKIQHGFKVRVTLRTILGILGFETRVVTQAPPFRSSSLVPPPLPCSSALIEKPQRDSLTSRVKPSVKGITKISSVRYHPAHPYFGNALDLGLYLV
jgi:hypothetical protein